MKRNLITPKDMYDTYAPGLPITGYYECLKCGAVKVKVSYCVNCQRSMTRRGPKIDIPGAPIIFDLSAGHVTSIKREQLF